MRLIPTNCEMDMKYRIVVCVFLLCICVCIYVVMRCRLVVLNGSKTIQGVSQPRKRPCFMWRQSRGGKTDGLGRFELGSNGLNPTQPDNLMGLTGLGCKRIGL